MGAQSKERNQTKLQASTQGVFPKLGLLNLSITLAKATLAYAYHTPHTLHACMNDSMNQRVCLIDCLKHQIDSMHFGIFIAI